MIFDDLPDDVKAKVNAEYQNDAVFADIPDFNTLCKNYKESKSYASKLRTESDGLKNDLTQAIRLPSSEASKEDQKAFYENLVSKAPNIMMRPMGKPDTAEGYQFPEVEGLTLDDGRKKMLTESALVNNMTSTQFTGMAKILMESDKEMIAQQQFATEKQDKALKDKWGMAYPDRMGQALAAFNNASGQNAERLNPEMAEVFYSVSEQIGTQNPQIGGQVGGHNNNRLTPIEADLKMQEILANKDHIVNQQDSEARDRYLETEWAQLQEYAST